MPDNRLKVMVAAPLAEELATLLVEREPRIDLVYEPELLPPMRFPADYSGDPAFRRSEAAERRFAELIDSADALYGIPDVDPARLRRAVDANPQLRWVHTMAAGGGGQVKAAGLSAEQLARVAFTTSAGVHGAPLAEFAIFGVFAGAKDLVRLNAQQREHRWSDRWTMRQVDALTVLVLGTGGIGRVVGDKLRALGATTIGLTRRAGVPEGFDRAVSPDGLLDALAEVDAVINTLPGTEATTGLVDAEFLSRLQPHATLVNVGRGTVFDEPAVIDHLQRHPDALAVLDVFAQEPLVPESPLWDLPNVIVSPHTAALTDAEERRIAELFAANATRLLDGAPLVNRVDTVEFY